MLHFVVPIAVHIAKLDRTPCAMYGAHRGLSVKKEINKNKKNLSVSPSFALYRFFLWHVITKAQVFLSHTDFMDTLHNNESKLNLIALIAFLLYAMRMIA